MSTINKYGLDRTIPPDIKRQVRKECGFGCIVCGNSIYQYEHIIPEFKDAKSHDVDKIGLLCGSCHDKVTRSILPKDFIQQKRESPICLDNKVSNFEYYINPKDDITIILGKIKFINTPNILVINSCNILSILPPEIEGSPPIICATFFDRNGEKVAWINNNEWFGDSNSFDIESVGATIKIRSSLYKIDLKITLSHPNTIQIDNLNLDYNNNSITGNNNKGFTVKTKQSKIMFGHEPIEYQNVPFGISIQGNKIYLGSPNVANFTNLKGETSVLPGLYEIDGGEINLDYGESEVPKVNIKSDGTGSGFGIRFNLPDTEVPKINLNFKKQERNKPCICGSQKKYKFCCEKNEGTLNKLVNKPSLIRTTEQIFAKHKPKEIIYQFHHNPTKNPTWLHWQNEMPIIMINSAKSFYESNIAYSLLCWDLKKEGFKFIFGTYSDGKETVLMSLQDLLLSIPILERLKLEKFDVSRFYKDEISFIKSTMENKVPNNNDKKISGVSLIEASKILRLRYNTGFLSQSEFGHIEELFRTKSPIAYQISKQLLTFIDASNIYEKDGYNSCLLKSASLFNNLSNGKFIEFIEKIKME